MKEKVSFMRDLFWALSMFEKEQTLELGLVGLHPRQGDFSRPQITGSKTWAYGFEGSLVLYFTNFIREIKLAKPGKCSRPFSCH